MTPNMRVNRTLPSAGQLPATLCKPFAERDKGQQWRPETRVSKTPEQTIPNRAMVATSLALAIGNVVVSAVSMLIMTFFERALPDWLWALSFLWLVTLGPGVLPVVTLAFAVRDLWRGRGLQAASAIAVAILTGAALWGRIKLDF